MEKVEEKYHLKDFWDFGLKQFRSAIFGITIIHLNPKGKLNRQFFIISIALCFWSFGFAMSNSAENMEICLFWRRFSALGWTVVYSMLLHMILILSGKNKVLKKK